MKKNVFISSIIELSKNLNKDNIYTHDIYRWYGKLPPELVTKLLSLYTNENSVVFANFLGSGTVALESLLRGNIFFGTDINPLSSLLTKVKTTPLKIAKIDSLVQNIILKSNKKLDMNFENENVFVDPKWFEKDVLVKLVQLKSVITSFKDEKTKNFLIVSLLSILRDCSNVDSRSVNHIVFKKNIKKIDVFKIFHDKVMSNYKKINTLPESLISSEFYIYNDSSDKLNNIKSSSFDFIISHPPYYRAINYSNINRLSTDFMGFSNYEIKNSDASSKKLPDFLNFMNNTFSETFRVLKTGGRAAVIIGDLRASGKIVPLGLRFLDLLIKNKFEIEDIFIWKLNKKAGMSLLRHGNHIDHNYIFIVKKED
jgi:site-specific DNA-methyltransferase (cytosine-N4-specific)